MAHWAAAPLDRSQITLFAPTLDDSIASDHPVRLFDEVLRSIDFGQWESMYVRVAGQPPIHPRTMAGGILYGLSVGIRSSRRLEDACRNRLDFMWLMEGRVPDHSTFCGFRTDFDQALKEMFHKVGRVGIELGLITLNQVMLDGTDIRANNSRHKTARRATLEQKISVLDQQIEQMMQQAAAQDKAENELYGESSPAKLPRELRDLQRRQQKLQEAMKKLAEREEARAGRKDLSAKGPAVPLVDPDSRVLPNKTGGYAPNYTAVLATDANSGMIVDTQLLCGNDEPSTVLPAVANIEAALGQKPKQLVADGGFNSGPAVAQLEQQNVEPLMPAKKQFAENPAHRDDPSAPVPAEQRDKLPVNPQAKILDKSAFLYDQEKDCYHCPMGQTLAYSHNNAYQRDGRKGTYRVYQCGHCQGCPLAARCLPKNATQRRVNRDEYEAARERMARRITSPQGIVQYKKRSHVAETPFATLKGKLNFRQFLLRGRVKTTTELRWMSVAYNLMKLMAHKAATMLMNPMVTAPR